MENNNDVLISLERLKKSVKGGFLFICGFGNT